MTNNHIARDSEHQEVSALIPWYVNSTLADRERLKVDAHIAGCAACRADLLLERRIFAGIKDSPSIDYMPAASLKRLHARLDVLQSGTGAANPSPAAPGRGRRSKHGWSKHGLKVASIAVVAITISLVLADRWVQFRARQAAPSYRTVTSSPPRARDEVIRAVFSPTITLVEMQAILEEAGLRIISGPTEAGVYSLASKTSRPVPLSLALLRQHTAVRFAEQTRPEPESGTSP
ncbi:MAG: zf-HC2 domain-containing protein [Steroidobacteraceae bacterium]